MKEVIRQKRIAHVQAGLKANKHLNDEMSIKDFSELTLLIGDQFDDMNSNTVKRCSKESWDVLDQEDTISIEEIYEN